MFIEFNFGHCFFEVALFSDVRGFNLDKSRTESEDWLVVSSFSLTFVLSSQELLDVTVFEHVLEPFEFIVSLVFNFLEVFKLLFFRVNFKTCN